jgi:hypothetical protein
MKTNSNPIITPGTKKILKQLGLMLGAFAVLVGGMFEATRQYTRGYAEATKEWQAAAAPVFEARGMTKSFAPSSTPSDLRNALDASCTITYHERSKMWLYPRPLGSKTRIMIVSADERWVRE